jgi:hypothetical protein
MCYRIFFFLSAFAVFYTAGARAETWSLPRQSFLEDVPAQNQNAEKDLDAAFRKFDLNRDGDIGPNESSYLYDVLSNRRNLTVHPVVASTAEKFEPLLSAGSLNGKIGPFRQGRSGACWLLSGINSLSYTEGGRKVISNSIEKDCEGNVTVYLRGVGKQYTIPPSELVYSAEDRNVLGDYDVRALEFAFRRYRTEVIIKNKNNPYKNDSILTYGGEGTVKKPLNAGYLEEGIYILTGRMSITYYRKPLPKERQAPRDARLLEITKEAIPAFLKTMKEYPSRYAVTCCFDSGSDELEGKHAYSVKSTGDDSVVLVNPWDSRIEKKVKLETVMKHITMFSMTDMND